MMRSDRRASLVAQTVKNLPAVGSDPWVRKIPWRREWQLTAVFLPGKSHGQRSMVGYTAHGVAKSGHEWVTAAFTFRRVIIIIAVMLL